MYRHCGMCYGTLVRGENHCAGKRMVYARQPAKDAFVDDTVTDSVTSTGPRTCDLLDLSSRLTQQTAAEVAWQPSKDLEGVQGDETMLTQVLGQLLANAVKFSPPGKRIEFSGERIGGEAVFRVADQGIGIPEEDMPKLFTPFGRASNAAAIPGSGLGLLIVKRCLEQHGGSIEVDSAVGRGTTFTVRLPLFASFRQTAGHGA